MNDSVRTKVTCSKKMALEIANVTDEKKVEFGCKIGNFMQLAPECIGLRALLVSASELWAYL